MLVPLIGENSGRIWQCLHEKGKMGMNQLQKSTGLDNEQMYLAIGWLAREDKICFNRKQKQLEIELKKI